jgi:hypothetical protein
MTDTKSPTIVDIVAAMSDRFVRQARHLNDNDESDKHLASLARAILAEAYGNSGIPSRLYGQPLSSGGHELVGTQAVALNAILMKKDSGKVVGRGNNAPETLAVVWEALVDSWQHAREHTARRTLAETLVAPTNTFTDFEWKKVDAALQESLKNFSALHDLLDLLSLPTRGINDLMVRRGVHTLAQKASPAQLAFAAACLGAVDPPSPYKNRDNERYWLIKGVCVEAVRRINELTGVVETIPFHADRGEPPHRRLKVLTPHTFEIAWHTSSHPNVFEDNQQYYWGWLGKADTKTRTHLASKNVAGVGVSLKVHFVEHKGDWGAGAERDEFPPIIKTLEKVVDV